MSVVATVFAVGALTTKHAPSLPPKSTLSIPTPALPLHPHPRSTSSIPTPALPTTFNLPPDDATSRPTPDPRRNPNTARSSRTAPLRSASPSFSPPTPSASSPPPPPPAFSPPSPSPSSVKRRKMPTPAPAASTVKARAWRQNGSWKTLKRPSLLIFE
uniref:Uncharacterized protein n=1 Tax=Kalanchoe fedtschenkoi TaxID=63787 RepID=A0A7N0SZE7_KALFE